MTVEWVREALTAAGVSAGFAQVVPGDAQTIAGGQLPDRWYVTPVSDGSWLVGAFDRGSFTPYDTYENAELTVAAVRHLFTAPVEPVTLDAEQAAQALDRARGVERLVRAGQPVSAGDVPPDTAFDTYGTLANHTMFVWQTSFPARANPPTDRTRPYVQLILRRELPEPLRIGAMAPAFEQPGGGVAIALPRCLRWFYDARIVEVFRTG